MVGSLQGEIVSTWSLHMISPCFADLGAPVFQALNLIPHGHPDTVQSSSWENVLPHCSF